MEFKNFFSSIPKHALLVTFKLKENESPKQVISLLSMKVELLNEEERFNRNLNYFKVSINRKCVEKAILRIQIR